MSMGSKIDKSLLDSLTDADKTTASITYGMSYSSQRFNELSKTIRLQREIIAEQAVKIRELQEKLRKYGWNE